MDFNNERGRDGQRVKVGGGGCQGEERGVGEQERVECLKSEGGNPAALVLGETVRRQLLSHAPPEYITMHNSMIHYPTDPLSGPTGLNGLENAAAPQESHVIRFRRFWTCSEKIVLDVHKE